MGKSEADRPAHETSSEEVEITPEMIAAGYDFLADNTDAFADSDFDPDEWRCLISRLYRIMRLTIPTENK